MKADLTGQIHELMEHGLRPVSMTEITSRAPARMTTLQQATIRVRLAGSRLILALSGSPASGFGRAISLGDRPRRPRRAIVAAAAAAGLAIIATVISTASLSSPIRPTVDKGALQLLAKVADAAARQPTLHVRDSQYMYIETK